MAKNATRQIWKPTGQEQPVACALCGAKDAQLLADENGYMVRRCRCGLVFVSPQPTAEDLALFYGQYFPEEAGDVWAKTMARNFDADAAYIAARRGPGKAFDIGAGHGHFLSRLKKAGWEVRGADLSEDAARQAQERYGITVAHEMFRPGLLAPESFDLVTAWYILEHVKDPAGFIAEAFKALKPGGLFGLRVPNMTFSNVFLLLKAIPGMSGVLATVGLDTDGKSSYFHVLDPPAHLYGYNPATLRALLSRVGFERAEVLPAKPVDFGTPATRLAKNSLFGGSELLYRATGGAFNAAPAITAFAVKPGR